MAAKKVDPGLQQIDAWESWFLSAHTTRLADLPLDVRERELADVTQFAAAVAQRMRDDYLTNRSRGTHHP